MNWASYVNNVPQTLDERRIEKSAQFRKEKRNEYYRKKRAAKKALAANQHQEKGAK